VENRPFVPLIDRGVLEASEDACVEGVVVPLMLTRHVADPPDAGAFPDAIERLRSDVARHLETSERQYAFVTGQTERGDVLGVILYLALKKAEVIGLTCGDAARTTRVTLSPAGVHLLHGFLVFVVHALCASQPAAHPYGEERERTQPPENTDVAAVQRHLLARVDAGDEAQALTLFGARVVDTFGRPTSLQARWYPNRGLASWEWHVEEGELARAGILFTLEQAALLSGFLTLLRLAFPDDWSWQE
jgi:hypothetical protein